MVYRPNELKGDASPLAPPVFIKKPTEQPSW